MAVRFVLLGVILLRGATAHAAAVDESSQWIEQLLTEPYAVPASAQPVKQPILQLVRQYYEQLEIKRSVIKSVSEKPVTAKENRVTRPRARSLGNGCLL